MDALSSVLKTIRLSGVIFLRADLHGRYGISMPPPTISHPSIKPPSPEHRLVMFHIVREGSGYVEVEGFSPRKLEQGDLIIVLDDLFHSIVDTPGRETIDSANLVPKQSDVAAPPEVEVGDDGDNAMRLVCGMLHFVDRGYTPLFSALPPFLHIRKDEGPASEWLQANISHVVREAEGGRPGSESLLSNLTELLFVETLRCYLEKVDSDAGWFAALKEPGVGNALELIHRDPARSWTVADLAKRVGMSRSAFAAKFSRLLGCAPMAYLTRWRIRLATNLLEDVGQSVGGIAAAVGYESEAAFSRAFKREIGLAPAAWRATRASATTANE